MFLVACGTLGGEHDPECADEDDEEEEGADATIFIQGSVEAIGTNGMGQFCGSETCRPNSPSGKKSHRGVGRAG